MRPSILYPLFAPITSCEGIGAKYAQNYAKLGISRIIDLLCHAPTGIVDRTNITTVDKLVDGEIATLEVVVDDVMPARYRTSPTKVLCHDDTGNVTLVFFKVFPGFLDKNLPIGAKRFISGKVSYANYGMQIAHPDYIVANKADMPLIETVYPLTAGVSLKMMHRAIAGVLAKIVKLPEWLDGEFKKRMGFPDWDVAIKALHHPQNIKDIEHDSPVKRRLAYDELLSGQLALAFIRARQKKQKGAAILGDGELRKKLISSLPFALTGAQERALAEIITDMAKPMPMHRLLQGDVGSGKTVVAFLALLNAVEAGWQGAFMVPTDILARQHYAKLKPLADMLGVEMALLTGKDTGKQKTAILTGIQSGNIKIVIGTHSLIQNDVVFNKLGLVVIDEQHRFGVHQRLTLLSKGAKADMLVMTATPIPRTLALTAYGDMDISVLDEKPKGRKPIKTVAIHTSKYAEVTRALKRAIDNGVKVYWICPLIEESEALDLAAATSRFQELDTEFNGRVGLVHGKIKPEDKEQIMREFANKKSQMAILVATTVVEVGVDVPIASIMVIEHAERFGLASLHQLRGRIGRGSKESSCILMYGDNLTATAKARIDTMRKTDDGFKIAEEDLRLRGFGEVLGAKQSGIPEFKFADMAYDMDLIHTAHKDAQIIVETNPNLEGDRGEALRTLLYLFGQDEKVKLLNG